MSGTRERQTWEAHWRALSRAGSRSSFGALASAVRRHLISRAVRHYFDRYFPEEGIFVEAGCGSGESAFRIHKGNRRLVGLDFSLGALSTARRQSSFHGLVCADIRHLPFPDGSVTGLWNLGVMEHFEPDVGDIILCEFHRVLQDRGVVLLFWPPIWGLSRWVLAPFEWLRSAVSGRRFRFFPDEVNRLGSRRAARDTMVRTGFCTETTDFSARDGFNHLIVVAHPDTKT